MMHDASPSVRTGINGTSIDSGGEEHGSWRVPSMKAMVLAALALSALNGCASPTATDGASPPVRSASSQVTKNTTHSGRWQLIESSVDSGLAWMRLRVRQSKGGDCTVLVQVTTLGWWVPATAVLQPDRTPSLQVATIPLELSSEIRDGRSVSGTTRITRAGSRTNRASAPTLGPYTLAPARVFLEFRVPAGSIEAIASTGWQVRVGTGAHSSHSGVVAYFSTEYVASLLKHLPLVHAAAPDGSASVTAVYAHPGPTP